MECQNSYPTSCSCGAGLFALFCFVSTVSQYLLQVDERLTVKRWWSSMELAGGHSRPGRSASRGQRNKDETRREHGDDRSHNLLLVIGI